MNERFNHSIFQTLLVFILVCILAPTSFGQDKSDPSPEDRRSQARAKAIEQMFKGMDQNNNGVIEPNESSDRTKNYIKSKGLDPTKDYPIDDLALRLASNSRKTTTSSESRKKTTKARKVPGFGVEKPKPEGVPDFSGAANNMTLEAMNKKYGENIVEQVTRTMDRYDRNKDNILDEDEIKRARWGNPKASDSDKNQDGRLTRFELAERYLDRERVSKSKSSSRSKKRLTTSKSTASDLKSRMEKYNSKIKSQEASRKRIEDLKKRAEERRKKTDEERKARSSTVSSTRNFNSGNDRFRRYADGLLKSYDKNRDGNLNAEELGAMRSPIKNADADGDGLVTRDELIQSISGANNPSKSKSETSRTKSSARKTFSQQKDKRKSSSRSKSTFSGADVNGDGCIEMSEYAERDGWTKSLAEEFHKKDINGDGMITKNEWIGR